jgi:hypothetical protein
MNKVLILAIVVIAAIAGTYYLTKSPDSGKQVTDTVSATTAPVQAEQGGELATVPPATIDTDPVAPRTPSTSYQVPAEPASEQLVEARLQSILYLQRRALRGDEAALETLRKLVKTGDDAFRIEAVELLSRSADADVQQDIMILLSQPGLSDDDVDQALLMIIGTFEEIEAALALEEPIDPSTIRRRGQ